MSGAFALSDEYNNIFPVIVTPQVGDAIQPNTDFNYTFKFTEDYDCTILIGSIDKNVTTDNFGTAYVNLNLSTLAYEPSFLCEYRNGAFRKTHFLNERLFSRILSETDLTNLGFTQLADIINFIEINDTSSWDKNVADDFSGNWSDLNGVPADLLDGDDDTTYSALSEFSNDVGFITGYAETDPFFSVSPAFSITNLLISNWNTAFAWGNHALVGYLTSESDPVFTSSPAYNITSSSSIYGSEFNLFESNPLSSHSTTTPQTKISGTTSLLPSGKYKITITYSWNYADEGKSFQSWFLFGGVAVGNNSLGEIHRQEPKEKRIDESFAFSKTYYVDIVSPTTKTVLLQYASTDMKLAQIWDANIKVIRVQ